MTRPNDMPVLGKSARPGSWRRLLVGLAVALLAVGAWRWWRRSPAAPPPAPVVAPLIAETPPPSSPPSPSPAPSNEPERQARSGGRQRVAVVIDGPLETALVHALGKETGRPLAQMVVRALVWWVAVPNELRRGDRVELLLGEGDELRLDALRFSSGKLGRTVAAYRFHAATERYARWYTADGKELELRLVESPLDDYEQVTSLLRDGRGHQGVDFKTALGTPVRAPFDAVVRRKNWQVRANGNSLELVEAGGKRRTFVLLHLSEVAPEVRVGGAVTHGQIIGQSGNTGHSFAPHLHYQVMSADGTVLDPFSAQATTRRALPDAERPTFDAERAKLDSLLEPN